MKSGLIKVIAMSAILVFGLGALSCSKGNAPKKEASKEKPAGHEKMVADYMKNMEEMKKVVAARVNGVVITRYELIDWTNKLAPNLLPPGQKMTPEIEQKAMNDALDTLIFRELAIQEAARQKISVKPHDIDVALQEFKANMGGADAYAAYLKKIDLSEAALRKVIERGQLYQLIMAKEVFGKVKVDNKMVRDRYNKDRKKFVSPEVLEIEEVVLKKGPDEAAAMKKAKEIVARLKKGEIAISALSKDNTLLYRQGEITEGEYPVLFKAASKIKQGGLSDVINESDGLHIVKVVKKEPPKQLSFEQARNHIEESMKIAFVEKRRQQWAEELRKKAKIEIVSAPEGVASAGGQAGKK